MIGLVIPLLLPTPTIWISLDQKRNVSDGVVRSGIGTLFSLDHKLYASDSDSDFNFNSVASETSLQVNADENDIFVLSLLNFNSASLFFLFMKLFDVTLTWYRSR